MGGFWPIAGTVDVFENFVYTEFNMYLNSQERKLKGTIDWGVGIFATEQLLRGLLTGWGGNNSFQIQKNGLALKFANWSWAALWGRQKGLELNWLTTSAWCTGCCAGGSQNQEKPSWPGARCAVASRPAAAVIEGAGAGEVAAGATVAAVCEAAAEASLDRRAFSAAAAASAASLRQKKRSTVLPWVKPSDFRLVFSKQKAPMISSRKCTATGVRFGWDVAEKWSACLKQRQDAGYIEETNSVSNQAFTS